MPEMAEPNGRKVAIIGSGPAGLTAAGDLRKKGYEVTVFEALHELGVFLSMASPSSGFPRRLSSLKYHILKG